jgi:hypothetical protein
MVVMVGVVVTLVVGGVPGGGGSVGVSGGCAIHARVCVCA